MNILEVFTTIQIVLILSESAFLQVPRQSERIYATPPVPTTTESEMINCPPSIVRKSAPLTPNTTMTPSQIMETMSQNKARYMPSFMAADDTGAASFPNLLSFSDSYEDDSLNISLNFHPDTDNAITKTKLLDDLNNWYKTPDNSVQTTVVSTVPFSTSTTVPRDSLVLQASLQSISEQFKNTFKNKAITDTMLRDFMKSNNITVHPRVLMQLQMGSAIGSSRVTRSTDGATTTIQYCSQKGSKTTSGFLNMCTACAATTRQAADKFPRYLNEVICDNNDQTCLTVQGTPHGACRQRYIHLNLLRRRPGGCRMMIKNGQRITVNEWETYTQRIRSGCECFIDKRSLFAKYIGPLGK